MLPADLEFSRLESWSRDPIFKVLVSVLMPKVSVLVLAVKVLGLGLETSLWLLNKCRFSFLNSWKKVTC